MKLKFGRINMDHVARIIVLVVADMVLITLSYIIATWLPFSGAESHYQFPFYVNGVIAFSYLQLLIYTAIYITVFALFRLYSKNWLEGLSTENFYVLAAIGVSTGLIFAVNVLFGNEYKLSLFLAGVLLIPLLFIERYVFRSLQRARRLILNRRTAARPAFNRGSGLFRQVRAGADYGRHCEGVQLCGCICRRRPQKDRHADSGRKGGWQNFRNPRYREPVRDTGNHPCNSVHQRSAAD
jgi:hypothetical protein